MKKSTETDLLLKHLRRSQKRLRLALKENRRLLDSLKATAPATNPAAS